MIWFMREHSLLECELGVTKCRVSWGRSKSESGGLHKYLSEWGLMYEMIFTKEWDRLKTQRVVGG